MTQKNKKLERTAIIQIRAKPEDKSALKKAAELEQRTLSNFLIIAGLERVKKQNRTM
jgi:uncharacterized protein (DUF1778 family)